jgi:hypothetical protein
MIGFLLGVFYVENRVQKLMDRNGLTDRYRVDTIPRNSDTSHKSLLIWQKRRRSNDNHYKKHNLPTMLAGSRASQSKPLD